MRKVGRTGFILLALALTSVAQAEMALADTNPQITPAPDNFKAQMDQFKIDKDKFLADMKMRNDQIRAINSTFKANCDKAASDFKSAMATAKGPDQKNAANVARKNAITAAISARDLAITQLGEPPVAPTQPTKSIKPAKGKNR